MSEKLGPMTYGSDEEEVFMGRDFGRTRNYSEDVAAEIDAEMRELIDIAYHKAEKLLQDNMETLHRLSDALLKKETLDAREFEKIFKGESEEEPEEEVQDQIQDDNEDTTE